MFNISISNKIEVTAGDTGIFEFSLENYTLKDGDKVCFTVKSTDTYEIVIFKEVSKFEEGIAKFILTSEDTSLDPGIYRYDIQCNLLDGRIDTVITPKNFVVLGGITNV